MSDQVVVVKEENEGGLLGMIKDIARVAVVSIGTAAAAVLTFQYLETAEFASDWSTMAVYGVTALVSVAALFLIDYMFKSFNSPTEVDVVADEDEEQV